MTIKEIKAAVDNGLAVRWANDGYHVIRDQLGQYLIVFKPNNHCIGLTNCAGNRLNGKAADFYIADSIAEEPKEKDGFGRFRN